MRLRLDQTSLTLSGNYLGKIRLFWDYLGLIYIRLDWDSFTKGSY